jgi:hypothetical protein
MVIYQPLASGGEFQIGVTMEAFPCLKPAGPKSLKLFPSLPCIGVHFVLTTG